MDKLDLILEKLEALKVGQNELQQTTTRIEQAVTRLEKNQPEDIIALLKTINRKLDERDYELQALNKRVFKVEGVIEKLTNQ